MENTKVCSSEFRFISESSNPIPQNLINQLSAFNSELAQTSFEQLKYYFAVYFLEIHLASENQFIELSLDSKCSKQLTKIYEKKIKNNSGEFLATVFSFIIEPEKIKKKEINNGMKSIKFRLKYKKEKFECNKEVKINQDNFIGQIFFNASKSFFGKVAQPPETFTLPKFEIFKLFLDALQIKERKTLKDSEFLELLKYGLQLYKENQKNEFEFYLVLFTNILNSNEQDLIINILNGFDIGNIDKKSQDNIPMKFQENFDYFYENQSKLLVKLMSNKNTSNQKNIKIIYNNPFEYMIIFYTVYLYYLYCSHNEFLIKQILSDINEKNEYDNLMIAKLYLSKFSFFYSTLPIDMELKYNIMSKILTLSKDYNDLIKSFGIISSFIEGDLVETLRIIVNNYDKIKQICMNERKQIKINGFIILKKSDDLKKVMDYLSTIFEKKLSTKYSTIYIELKTWDFYIGDEINNEFFEFLKKNLIYFSLTYGEIVDSLKYLSEHLNKSLTSTLEIIINSYDKICEVCRIGKNHININDFITQTKNDDFNKLKEQLTYITSKKLSDKYETVHFNIEIWLYYIKNNFDQEFLTFLQMKLFESAFYYEDICHFLLYSSTFKNKDFENLLEIINTNFEIINKICYSEKKTIPLEVYVDQKFDDDLSKIKNLIKMIIDKELSSNYNFIDFNINLWKKYLKSDNLDNLLSIRSIIYICQKINPNINEEDINLPLAIHIVGLKYIKEEKLTGDKLLKFLGYDEIFYDGKVKKLENENAKLKTRLENLESDVSYLKRENSSLKSRISSMEEKGNSLQDKVDEIEIKCNNICNDVDNLHEKVDDLSASIYSNNN